MEEKKEKETAPDGGWGWMVVLGAALINMVNQGLMVNYGLIFGKKLKDLADGRATALTLVMAMNVVITNFTGLLVGPLLKKLSLRSLTFVGIFLTGSGFIFCSLFSTAIWQVCIGYSVLTGMGLGMLYSVTFLAINQYFTNKRTTAVGLAMAGISVGQMTMPSLIGMLLENYDFSVTTLAIGLISYTGIIGASFFEPIFCCKKYSSNNPQAEKCNRAEDAPFLKDKQANGKSEGLVENVKRHHYIMESVVQIAASQLILHEPTHKENRMTKILNSIGAPLLKDPTFDHILLGVGFGYVCIVSFGAFFPLFLQEDGGLTLMETTSCMTILSLADFAGRLTGPEVCRRLRLGNRSGFMLGCALFGIAISCLAEMRGFKFLITSSFILGYCKSIPVINMNLVVAEYIENDKLPSAVGLTMVVRALLTLTVGQSLGILKDIFSYKICMHILNVMLLTTALAYLLEIFVKRLRSKKEPQSKKDQEQDL